MLPANAPVWIDRLLTWLEPFESAFGHVAQRGAFRRYLLGGLSDSPRKSMSAMLARVSEPGSYQALQHFVTDAPWAPDGIWRRLRQRVPARAGVLMLDGTSLPKQGTLVRSIRSNYKVIEKHLKELNEIRIKGGYETSVTRELRTLYREIEAYLRVLGKEIK